VSLSLVNFEMASTFLAMMVSTLNVLARVRPPFPFLLETIVFRSSPFIKYGNNLLAGGIFLFLRSHCTTSLSLGSQLEKDSIQ
jgi:hypothetical protein